MKNTNMKAITIQKCNMCKKEFEGWSCDFCYCKKIMKLGNL